MDDSIRYVDGKTGEIRKEQVYGDALLKWTYFNPLGRLSLHLLIKRRILSTWYGWLMDRPKSIQKIRPFIEQFHLDPSEFQQSVASFKSFNDFFYRKLKPEYRPIHSNDHSAVFPADGRHLAYTDVSSINNFFIKGVSFNLRSFLGDSLLASQFEKGSMVISRLCPVDYHRYHFPLSGIPSSTQTLNGPLYSVNPYALRTRPSIFWENLRCLTILKTEHAGSIAVVEIGATMVGSILQTFQPGTRVIKGAEKGYFAFGGSCVALLFEPGRLKIAEPILQNTEQGMETYFRMGDYLGEFNPL